jgi:hypothetical protein
LCLYCSKPGHVVNVALSERLSTATTREKPRRRPPSFTVFGDGRNISPFFPSLRVYPFPHAQWCVGSFSFFSPFWLPVHVWACSLTTRAAGEKLKRQVPCKEYLLPSMIRYFLELLVYVKLTRHLALRFNLSM